MNTARFVRYLGILVLSGGKDARPFMTSKRALKISVASIAVIAVLIVGLYALICIPRTMGRYP